MTRHNLPMDFHTQVFKVAMEIIDRYKKKNVYIDGDEAYLLARQKVEEIYYGPDLFLGKSE